MRRCLQEKQLRGGAEQNCFELAFFRGQRFFQELTEHRFYFAAAAQNGCGNGTCKGAIAGSKFCRVRRAQKGFVKRAALIQHRKNSRGGKLARG